MFVGSVGVHVIDLVAVLGAEELEAGKTRSSGRSRGELELELGGPGEGQIEKRDPWTHSHVKDSVRCRCGGERGKGEVVVRGRRP